MPKFLAIHPLPSPATVEETSQAAKKVKSLCNADAYWVGSWGQLNDEGKIVTIFCEWNGKDLKSIKDLLKNVELPTEGPYPMMKVDSEDFR
jgi:hypothetical protein